MKIRNGHVSNSSSSSFIIGIAEITDKKLLKQAFEDAGIDISKYLEISIRRSSELTNKSNLSNMFSNIAITDENNETNVTLESFTGAVLVQTLGQTPDIKVASLDDSLNKEWLIIDYTGDEGDGDFCNGYDYDCDYNIDESFFANSGLEHVLEWLKEPEKNGLKQAQYAIGAGRNG